MNLFDLLVDSALSAQPALASLRQVVEKEVLHHDILREMSKGGYLQNLTFIGGTCLRDCYGSVRLSEDLDFTGGSKFSRHTLSALGATLERNIHEKYGLEVRVSEPIRETGNVDTWSLRMVTRPEQPHLPSQRINIDICAIESHDRRPVMIKNHYGTDLGTAGLILNAESREEILADKIVATALRPNRVKYRDLWDIIWLVNQNIGLDRDLLVRKLADRHIGPEEFRQILQQRIVSIQTGFDDYCFEIQRFLPKTMLSQITNQDGYWDFLISVLKEILLK